MVTSVKLQHEYCARQVYIFDGEKGVWTYAHRETGIRKRVRKIHFRPTLHTIECLFPLSREDVPLLYLRIRIDHRVGLLIRDATRLFAERQRGVLFTSP